MIYELLRVVLAGVQVPDLVPDLVILLCFATSARAPSNRSDDSTRSSLSTNRPIASEGDEDGGGGTGSGGQSTYSALEGRRPVEPGRRSLLEALLPFAASAGSERPSEPDLEAYDVRRTTPLSKD